MEPRPWNQEKKCASYQEASGVKKSLLKKGGLDVKIRHRANGTYDVVTRKSVSGTDGHSKKKN